MRREPALWPAAAAASLLLGVSFYVLQRWLERGALSDVGLYEHYAALVRGGAVPYRDFALEYPPAALPAFLVPAWLPWSYATSFAVAMGVCGAGCVAAAAAALRAAGAGELRATAALLALGVSPLVLGALFDTRFDLWPALLAVAAFALLLRERAAAGGALAGLAFAAKLWPLALLPVGLAYLWRRRGGQAAASCAAAFALAAAACFVPFAALAPDGVRHSLTTQLDRPLQVESLGSSLLLALEKLGGPAQHTVTSHGGQALSGALPDGVAIASTAVEAALLLAIWVAFARLRRPSADAALVAAAASLAALLAFGKVFSPQFLIWLVPFAPLVRGLRGAAGSLLLLFALGLTQTWFPDDYWRLALDHASPLVWLLLARDLAVVALAALLALPQRLADDRAAGLGARLAALDAIRARAG
ncbi:MAG TPA: glycosyltransferase 87 family protein [Gaiellaceae bacterium]|nr:glycosyltransferase 87 family protein [Gaiellaceae bacterium]